MPFDTVLDARALAAALVVLVAFLALYLTFSGFSMVGVTPGEVILLLFISPFLAPVNLPVWTMPGVVIGVNAAGLGVPLVLSLRFLFQDRLPLWKAGLGTGVIAIVAFRVSRIAPDQGILVPALPLVVATGIVGLVLAGRRLRQLGPVTYTSGAVGVLVGADLFNLASLADPTREEAMFAVIGGAGTLDAIYLISLWAVVGTILAVGVARLFGAQAS